VAVGQDQPVAGDDDAGADAGGFAALGEAFDPHDRGADPVHDRDHGAGVGIEQSVVG
jgi:hypothetical protein